MLIRLAVWMALALFEYYFLSNIQLFKQLPDDMRRRWGIHRHPESSVLFNPRYIFLLSLFYLAGKIFEVASFSHGLFLLPESRVFTRRSPPKNTKSIIIQIGIQSSSECPLDFCFGRSTPLMQLVWGNLDWCCCPDDLTTVGRSLRIRYGSMSFWFHEQKKNTSAPKK